MKKILFILFCILAGVQTVKAQVAYVELNFDTKCLTFYYDELRGTRTGTTYFLNSAGTPGWSSDGHSKKINKVVFDASFAEARPTTTREWFVGCSNLTTIQGMQYLNTSQVTNMEKMFYGCSSLTSLKLSSFNTSNVTNMSFMFSGCTNMTRISVGYQFVTSKVTNMDGMFRACSSLTSLDLIKDFDTSNVTTMQYMFYQCDALTTLDLSSFETGKVMIMFDMFSECHNLETIYIGTGWDTSNFRSSSSMFENTTKIKGMAGTTYDASHVDKTYARLDEGTSKPGYMSTKTWGLNVGDVEVTDMNYADIPVESGKAVFNRGGNVLTLTDATVGGTGPSIICTNNNLTVMVKGKCTLNGSIRFSGSQLSFSSNDDASQLQINGMITFSGTLQFDNKNTMISTNGSSYMFMGSGTSAKMSFGRDATLVGMMNGGRQVMNNVTALTFTSPTGLVMGSLGLDDSQITFDATQKTILNGSSPLTDMILIGQYYPVWIGESHVSNAYMNLLNAMFNQELYKFYYDENNVFVMKTNKNLNAFSSSTFKSEAPNLRVEMGGNWNVSSTDADVPAMDLRGNTTITGDGKLTVTSDGVGININALSGDLTIDGIDMEVTAAKQGINGSTRKGWTGLVYNNSLVFKNSNATITSTGSGTEGYCLSNIKDLVFQNCTITNGVTFANNHIAASQVVIGPYSIYDVNLDGQVGIGDIVAITNVMAGTETDPSIRARANVNGDLSVGIGDIVAITNAMAGISTTPEPGTSMTKNYTVNGVTFTMVNVEGGTFQMGSNDSYSNQQPVHNVTLSSFSIGQTEVTQQLWYAVMGQKPTADGEQWSTTNGLGDQYPAYDVSWNDIQEFITKLNQLTGQQFRLPTEAEWEFAARGGNSSKGYTYAGSNTIGDVAWYWDNIPSQSSDTAGYGAQPVGTKQANELGLYDMSGNVSEWCQDWYGSYSSEAQTNPTGPDTGTYPVVRYGSWKHYATFCTVAYRNYDAPKHRFFLTGFRLAL
jgi:surface protein